MENFYVTYDATDAEQLRVGLSYNLDESDIWIEVTTILALILCFVFVAVFTVVMICHFCKQKRQRDLRRAKTFFEIIKSDEDEEEQYDEGALSPDDF